ncbi:MAG TPA: hypothetical protein VGR71_03695 [Nitrospira sp.]|nr:hypothetical protein [Nitrospira sp.]
MAFVAGIADADVFIGFVGSILDAQRTVETPWGQLTYFDRPIGSADMGWIKASKTVLKTIVRIPVQVGIDTPYSSAEEIGQRSKLAEIARDLALSALLVESRPIPVVLGFSWAVVLLPWSAIPPAIWPDEQPIDRPFRNLTPDEADQLAQWSRRIHSGLPPALNIAAIRTIRALSGRPDTRDAVLDAFIALESLFGSSTEITFRLAAAIARLREPDQMSRQERFRSLKRAYNVRSRIIHGEPVEDRTAVNALATAAFAAIDSLRILLSSRGDLRALTSEQRSERLLLE